MVVTMVRSDMVVVIEPSTTDKYLVFSPEWLSAYINIESQQMCDYYLARIEDSGSVCLFCKPTSELQ